MTRDLTSDGVRPHAKYLDRLDDIRRVQSYIVARAKRHSVPVIDNTRIDGAIMRVIELVLEGAEEVQRVG
jgi:2-phosphoglycerate kinase